MLQRWRVPAPTPPFRSLVFGWVALALAAIGIATVLSVALVYLRASEAAMGIETFRRALVIHVDFAAGIWFLAAGGLLVAVSRPGRLRGALSLGALASSASGMALMLLAYLAGHGPPLLLDYVPLLDSPVFLTGVWLQVITLALLGLACAATPQRPAREEGPACWLFVLCLRCAGLIALCAIATLPVLGTRAGLLETADLQAWALVTWGGGHLFQSVAAFWMAAAWVLLSGAEPGGVTVRRVLIAVCASGVLAGAAGVVAVPEEAAAARALFTQLMIYGSWPGPLAVGFLCLAHARVRAPRTVLAGGVALFALGLVAGAQIEGNDLRIPAHYHAVVGAATLTFMGLIQQRVAVNAAPGAGGRIHYWAPAYLGGMLMIVMAFEVAGLSGLPRKALAGSPALTWLLSVGATVAVAAVCLFIAQSGRGLAALLHRRGAGNAERDALPLAREEDSRADTVVDA